MEKNIHSLYRKKLQNKLLTWIPLAFFQFLTLNPSCYFVVCKTRKTNHL